ncbi:MAG: hypothetical protein M5U05_18050 [Anaerolineales bacterium]|nr:hypothetical protein [Anaerolineales bacterium]
MKFVASLTMDASLLKKLLALWDASGDSRNPFESVLVTPLFASASTLKMIREDLKEKRGAQVYFDSGGYYVQQGKIGFEQLYQDVRAWYSAAENQWADWYVLPDNVPTSGDCGEVVEQKVNETVAAAKMFFAEAPAAVLERCMAVVHGHELWQVNRCIESYLGLGVKYLGFGSFGTGGGDNVSINQLDKHSAEIVAHLASGLCSCDVLLHTFGISTPPAVYAFKKLGFSSFDSLGWQRSAGYGKVYMPFTRAYNVSHRSIHNSALTRDEFVRLCLLTGHECPFCVDFRQLSEDRLYRSLHNLVVLMETGNGTGESRLSQEKIARLIEDWSPRYYRLFQQVYNG